MTPTIMLKTWLAKAGFTLSTWLIKGLFFIGRRFPRLHFIPRPLADLLLRMQRPQLIDRTGLIRAIKRKRKLDALLGRGQVASGAAGSFAGDTGKVGKRT